MERPPTIYDVARAAGVAPSTVSRAFSRPGRVNAATAERIRAVAAELGYRTNPLASALPTGRTSMLAVASSDITNPYYAEIIRAVQNTAAESGYTCLIVDAQESDRLERTELDRAIPVVEGIVLAGSRMSNSAIRQIAKQRPTIVLNRDVSDVQRVVADHPQAMQHAVDHLQALGHDQITYLSGPEAAWADGMRWRTLLSLATERGLHVQHLAPHAPTVAGGVAAATEFRHSPTRAVIAYNDLMAIGFLRGVLATGLRVPQDVSVVGFDNVFASSLVTPGLTTVAAPLRTMGSVAVRNLIAAIGGAPANVHTPVTLPTRLVVRASTSERRPRSARRHRRRPAGSAAAPASRAEAVPSTTAPARVTSS